MSSILLFPPTEIGFYDTPDYFYDVYVSGFFVYGANGDRGLSILSFKAPGIIDVQPTGIAISEPSGTGEFIIKLGSQPTADVTIDIIGTNPGECTISPSSVVLNSANWESGVTVYVTAEDDGVVDGPQITTILTKPAKSNDPDYDGSDPANVIVTVLDDATEPIIFAVEPSYGIAGQTLDVNINGANFINGTTPARIYISDYPSGGNEIEITSYATEINSTSISITIPAQEAVGEYNLKVSNGANSFELPNALTFTDSNTVEQQKLKKAIIVAGGGMSADNDLWTATLKCVTKAYTALLAQGYTEESIFFLCPDNNDADRNASWNNLYYALNYWLKHWMIHSIPMTLRQPFPLMNCYCI